MIDQDILCIGSHEFSSRLMVGTGKYKDFVETRQAIEASGAEVVTVAVRRVNITDSENENLLDYVDPKNDVYNNAQTPQALSNSDVVEFIKILDALKQKNKINVCNRVWNGYGKYTNLTNQPCNADCENIKCDRFENYSKYLKNKQIVGIVELR